ncbi:Ger(x)C family spore germination protein [Salipaludibacillus sp. HK11]|uniref:Ger(x)C family spore germination protein n=1 Tax=Salipaludibacillus sp. HK11 TaxID=3394320 RepID=UPI0039FC5310
MVKLKKQTQFVILILLMLTASCSRDERIIEDIAFVQTKGYDLLENDDLDEDDDPIYQLTTSAPLVEPDRTSPMVSRRTVARLNKEGVQQNARTTERTIVTGQLRLLLYSHELAENGLAPLLDAIERDPQVPARTKMAIVDGEAGPLMEMEFDEHPRTTVYLDELLDKEARFNVIPDTKVYQFFRDLKDDSRDPVLPVIKLEEDSVVVSGIALFENDKYQSQLGLDDSLILFFMERQFDRGDLIMSIPNNETNGNELVAYTSLSSKRDFKVEKSKKGYEVTISIDIRGIILENIGDIDITKVEGQKKLEKLMEEFIKNKAEEIVVYTQENKVDPIGIGTQVRNSVKYDEWESLDWREEWPKVTVNCEVEIDIRDYGMIAEE